MEDGIVLHYPDGSCFLGILRINDSELVFFEKNEQGIFRTNVMVNEVVDCFAPNSLASIKKRDRVQIDEIVEAKRKRYRLNKNAYYLTLKDGNTYVLIFDHPNSTIDYLESVIRKAANIPG